MSHLLQRTIDIKNPIGVCNLCQAKTRVFCLSESYDNQFCHNCCDIRWGEKPTGLKIAELAQSLQNHEPMRLVDAFKPVIIEPDGNRFEL